MLYKPNFCCNCGEKIERADWNLLTSRRFCEACAAENTRHDNLPRLAVAGGILAMTFGLGTLLGGRQGPAAATQTLGASPATLRAPAPRSQPAEPPVSMKTAPAANASTAVNTATAENATVVRPSKEGKPESSKTYFCGALTKKGTPCSRKVKTQGMRCYQHEGKPAAVPNG